MKQEFSSDVAMERNDGASSRTLARVLIALVTFGITFATVMVAAGVLCFYLPRQYYSQVTIEMKVYDMGFQQFSNDNSSRIARDRGLGSDRYKAWNQSAPFCIQSKEILYPVIDNLKLVEAWGNQEGGRRLSKEEVYRTLRNRIQASSIRNTDLIHIGVFSKDRAEAANIANMTAVVYRKVREDDEMQIRNAALGQLQEEIGVQRKNVEALHAKMQAIGSNEGAVDPTSEELSAGNSANQSEEYRKAKADYLKTKTILGEAEKRLATQSVQLKMFRIRDNSDKAEPAVRPSKPNVAAIMFIAAAAGVFFGLFFAGIYLLTSRPRRPSPAAVAKAV